MTFYFACFVGMGQLPRLSLEFAGLRLPWVLACVMYLCAMC
jgi:hypothetical protein